jgi:hypothetical protein
MPTKATTKLKSCECSGDKTPPIHRAGKSTGKCPSREAHNTRKFITIDQRGELPAPYFSRLKAAGVPIETHLLSPEIRREHCQTSG